MRINWTSALIGAAVALFAMPFVTRVMNREG